MRRRQAVRPLPVLLLVPVLAVRLAFDLLALLLRAVVWLLLRACWLLEYAIDRLRTERAAAQATLRPFATRAANRRIDLDQFMKATGTKDRALAERLLARAHPTHKERQ